MPGEVTEPAPSSTRDLTYAMRSPNPYRRGRTGRVLVIHALAVVGATAGGVAGNALLLSGARRIAVQDARPRNTIRDRSMSAMRVVGTRPIRSPRFDRRTVVILSIMAKLG